MVKIIAKESDDLFETQDAKISIADMKKKHKFTHLTFHGNPKRLIAYLKSELEDNNYDIKYDNLDTREGGMGDGVADVLLRVYAEKRKDIQGKIKKRIPSNVLMMTGMSLILLIVSFYLRGLGSLSYIGILLFLAITILGFWLIFKGPKQKIYSYYPNSNIIWVVGEGEAFFGSRTQQSRSGNKDKAGSSHSVSTSYLTSDMDVNIAADTVALEKLYRERILKDKEKISPPIITLIKATRAGIKEISMENEEAYKELPTDKEGSKKHISTEMESISKKLNKFMKIN